jgi:hypothetical protein
MSEVTVANVGADGNVVGRDNDLSEREAADIHKTIGSDNVELHQVKERGATGEERSLGVGGDSLGGGFGGARLNEGKWLH